MLHRENPVAHPTFATLSAASVSFQDIAPKGTPGQGSKVPGSYAASLPAAAYQYTLATVRFIDFKMPFYTDVEVFGDEVQRNTFFSPVPSVEIISAEGLNNIKFANGPSRGAAIPAPFGTLMSKMTKTFNWMWVPHEYISGSDPTQFTPQKILNCIGCVNSTTWNGHPAGTLLLQAPVFTRFRFPVQTNNGLNGYFGWNVALPMQFFDPRRGTDDAGITNRISDTSAIIQIPFATADNPINVFVGNLLDITWTDAGGGSRTDMLVTAVDADNGFVTISGGVGDALPPLFTSLTVLNQAFRGHQLVPRREDLKWYGAIRQNGVDKLYPEANFNQIFTHVSAP